MKKLAILLFFIILNFFVSKSQEIFKDSTIVMGVLSEASYVGLNIGNNCIIGKDNYLAKGSPVIIGGVYTCKNDSSPEASFIYEIYLNGIGYYIPKNLIIANKFEFLFDDINKLSEEKKVTFRSNAQKYSIQAHEFVENAKTEKALASLRKTKQYGISLLSSIAIDESEYTSGTGVKFRVFNPTAKTIKYVYFNFIGLNPVGDKVPSGGVYNFQRKGVGPIKPYYAATYEFEYVWMTDLVEKIKISSIKVQYMDGSIKLIVNPKLVSINSADLEILDSSFFESEN